MIPYQIAEMEELEDQLDMDENAKVSMDAIIDSYLKENKQEDSENDDEYTEPPHPLLKQSASTCCLLSRTGS